MMSAVAWLYQELLFIFGRLETKFSFQLHTNFVVLVESKMVSAIFLQDTIKTSIDYDTISR